MHTYHVGAVGSEHPGVNVWFVGGNADQADNWFKIAGPFPDVATAAAYVSYLNGSPTVASP
jgi:hypothetical protein